MPNYTLNLCGKFYHEIIQPVVDSRLAGLPHAAALIGRGSEVLGFDDEVSQDHDWGPRVLLFLNEQEFARQGTKLRQALTEAIPATYRGHRVDCEHTCVFTLAGYCQGYLNFDISREIETADWLTIPEQKLRGITTGAVYHDAIGLQAVRDRVAYYPRDVWLYLLLSGWNRIRQEEHLMGRSGSVGDELGSAVIASRLVRDIMRLCFLMERQYAPYAKWFGTAFSKLGCAADLMPVLRRIQTAQSWQDREEHFAAAWEQVSATHNRLLVDPPLQTSYSQFFTRAYRVYQIDDFCEEIRAKISDPAISRLAKQAVFGGIDQWSDSTDVLDYACWRPALRRLYEVASQ